MQVEAIRRQASDLGLTTTSKPSLRGQKTSMLTLYHSPTTRSFRIKWLLRELGTPYEEKLIYFYGPNRCSPEYLRVNPAGTFPAMVDGDLTLTESGAMINHILAYYGDGRFTYPNGSREATLVDEWMYWSEGVFAVHQRMYWDHGIPTPGSLEHTVPGVGEYAERYCIRYAGMLERALREDGFMVGDQLTGADFMLCFPLFTGNMRNWFDKLPKIRAYLSRITSRPAFQYAIADTMEALIHLRDQQGKMPSWRSFEPPGMWDL